MKGLKGESGKPDEFIAEWTIRRERTNQSKQAPGGTTLKPTSYSSFFFSTPQPSVLPSNHDVSCSVLPHAA